MHRARLSDLPSHSSLALSILLSDIQIFGLRLSRRTWLSWFGVCLIAVQQNGDPGPWVFINSIARPILGLAQLNYTVVLQPRHYAIGWVRPCTGVIGRQRESNPDQQAEIRTPKPTELSAPWLQYNCIIQLCEAYNWSGDRFNKYPRTGIIVLLDCD